MLEFVVGTVALIVAKYPNSMNRVNEGSKGAKNAKFVNRVWVKVIKKEPILEMAPMSGT